MTDKPTLDAAYFEDLYQRNPDPWDFQSSAYEDAKYTATIAALDGRHYRRGLEIGCSIGVLTRRLAVSTDTLLALDVSQTALAAAKARNADLPQVRFATDDFMTADLGGGFDLILLSEVLYYLSEADLRRAARRVAKLAELGADILLVHWLGETGYPLTGDEAAEGFMQALGPSFTKVRQRREPRYRLDLLRAPLLHA